jgi:D-3-phosphoglycerate dehydrogenase
MADMSIEENWSVKRFKVVQVANDDHRVPDWVPKQLENAGIEFSVSICWNKEDLTRHASDADVVWLYSGRHLLKGESLSVLKRCGAILRTGSGTDNVDVKLANEMGIIVVNTPQAVTDSGADHAISLLFALVRQVVFHDRMIRRGEWNHKLALPGRRYREATLGLVGFGHISRLVIQKLSGFEMNFVAYDPYINAETMAAHGAKSVAVDELLQTADYIIMLCPLTEETHHMISERELRLMQSNALFVNISRGEVVDEQALIKALQEGWIAGAALDVLEKEPPEPDNPLLTMENLILTPHFAGYSDSYLEDNYAASVEAIIDLAEGRWPRSVVNPDVTPRWGRLSSPVHG